MMALYTNKMVVCYCVMLLAYNILVGRKRNGAFYHFAVIIMKGEIR